MLSIRDISFPSFALFQRVQRHDRPGEKQLQFRKTLKDGRMLIVTPDMGSLEPIDGKTIPVMPGRVIFEGPKLVIATCFVNEKYSMAHKMKLLLFNQKHGQHKEKKEKKPITGRFAGETPTMDPEEARAKLARAKNVYRSSAEIPQPKVVSKKETKKGKKNKKADQKQRRRQIQVAGG